MNSPTASIAVRGTEFSIEVADSGDTQVIVYEGAVQVTSLSDPSQTVLIEAGRGVLVQAGQDFHLLAVAANQVAARQGSDDQQRRSSQGNQGYNDQQSGGSAASPNYAGQNSGSQSHADSDAASLRATSSAYDNYMTGLSSIYQVPLQLRFNALREAHLDSLENPAFATQFEAPEGRVFALPAFGGPGSQGSSPNYAGSQSGDYSVAPQFSMFSPVGHTGFFGGGSVSAARSGDSSLTASPDDDAVNSAQTRLNGSSTSTFYSGSLVLAYKIGPASSFGLEVDTLRGSGSLSSTATDYDTQTSVEQISSASRISQTRLTAGFSRELNARTKLGIFYRYGFISATDGDLSHTLNGSPLGLNSTDSGGHSSEIGFRLRGQLRPKLFYGMTGSWMGVALGSALVRTGAVNSYEFDRAQRGSLGAGIGYYLRPRVLFIFDASAGTSRVAAHRVEDATGNSLQNGTANSHVFSTHAAVQVDVTRRLFVSLSYLHAWHAQQLNVSLFPDRTGASVAVQDSFFPTAPSPYQLASHFSDLGLGWRFTPQLFAQYVFSTDYGATAPAHSLALRYVFRVRRPGL